MVDDIYVSGFSIIIDKGDINIKYTGACFRLYVFYEADRDVGREYL